MPFKPECAVVRLPMPRPPKHSGEKFRKRYLAQWPEALITAAAGFNPDHSWGFPPTGIRI